MQSGHARAEGGTPASLFALIHDLHATITTSIDSSLSWDQLNSPPVDYSLVRPIIDKLVSESDEKHEATTGTALLSVPAGNDDNTNAELGAQTSQPIETCLGAVLFALMANRSVVCTSEYLGPAHTRLEFIRLADTDLSYAPLQTSRAAFCELLASTCAQAVCPAQL